MALLKDYTVQLRDLNSTNIADWALLCLYQMCMVRLFKVLFVALLNYLQHYWMAALEECMVAY